jgi:hypothetical protein
MLFGDRVDERCNRMAHTQKVDIVMMGLPQVSWLAPGAALS